MYANQSNRETSKGRSHNISNLPNELLQVAALGYTFLGTSKDNSEKIVGPKKARTNPRKTKVDRI
jgi:hypothetical protein